MIKPVSKTIIHQWYDHEQSCNQHATDKYSYGYPSFFNHRIVYQQGQANQQGQSATILFGEEGKKYKGAGKCRPGKLPFSGLPGKEMYKESERHQFIKN